MSECDRMAAECAFAAAALLYKLFMVRLAFDVVAVVGNSCAIVELVVVALVPANDMAFG